MRIFLPCNSPDLLDGIQIRRIGRKLQKCNLFRYIRVFRLLFGFNQSKSFLMPRGVIHYKDIMLSFRCRFGGQKFADRSDCCLIIEYGWPGNKQFPCARNHKATVRGLESAGERFHRRCASFFEPSTSDGCLYLEMHFVLIDKDCRIVRFYFDPFFLNPFRSSVSS